MTLLPLDQQQEGKHAGSMDIGRDVVVVRCRCCGAPAGPWCSCLLVFRLLFSSFSINPTPKKTKRNDTRTQGVVRHTYSDPTRPGPPTHTWRQAALRSPSSSFPTYFVSSGGPSPPSIRSHANILLARASKEGRMGGPPGLLCVWGPPPSDTRLVIIPPRSLALLALTFPYSFVFFLTPPRPLKTPGRQTNNATLFFWCCRRSHTLP
jgi:hypothetical protein